ncbi:hypothetical protein LIER_09727 [Lithospermum erythrorhizon]|uniref:Uncharacterized protein n=1 Tax=Lithospermum erythrorhizon TaxID=34254 RepID=A0AAV3PKR5_LITER
MATSTNKEPTNGPTATPSQSSGADSTAEEADEILPIAQLDAPLLIGHYIKKIEQATGKKAEIHGDSSSVGFSTPEKGSIFTKVSTPSSWAD